MPLAGHLIGGESEGQDDFEGGEDEALPGQEEEASAADVGRVEAGRYHCPECECSYAQRKDLYFHLRGHHKTLWDQLQEQIAQEKEAF